MRQIKGGLYLVVDPMPGLKMVLPKIVEALKGGVDVIQLWNHWNKQESHEEFIRKVCDQAHDYNVPVLINENWQWLQSLPLDGIHFDSIPENLNQIKELIKRPFSMGITCGNDWERIQWTIDNKLDYISFCSIFSSSTSNSCELVQPDLIRQTRALTNLPIYAAGGLTFNNISFVMSLGADGIAIVSGIMKADDPKIAAQKFKQSMVQKTIL